jgi:hypothetical protein
LPARPGHAILFLIEDTQEYRKVWEASVALAELVEVVEDYHVVPDGHTGLNSFHTDYMCKTGFAVVLGAVMTPLAAIRAMADGCRLESP